MVSPGSDISRDPAVPTPGGGAGEARRPRGLEALADFCKDPSAEPDHPLLPDVVSFYGTLIMILGVFGMIAAVVWVGLSMAQPSGRDDRAGPVVFVAWGIRFLVSLIYVRLGKGMRSGERLAFFGFCAIGAVESVFLMWLAIGMSGAPLWIRLIPVLVIGLLYLPPIVSALRHWSAFH